MANAPLVEADPFTFKEPISHVGRLPGGMLAISGGKGSEFIGLFEPASEALRMRALRVPGALACTPVVFGRGLMAPCKAGQVCWLASEESKSGEQLCEPFQPRVEPGVDVDWLPPVLVSDTQVVLYDGKMSVYLIGVQDQPKMHLGKLGQASVGKSLEASPAVLGQSVFTVDISGSLGMLSLPGLGHGNDTVLGGRRAWGPARVGENLLVSTDDGQLLCVDSKGSSLWRVPLKYGPLAGAPLRIGLHLLLASRTGVVWRIEAATGKELAKVDAGCPLATGPVLCGERLLVGGHDGTLYEVRQP